MASDSTAVKQAVEQLHQLRGILQRLPSDLQAIDSQDGRHRLLTEVKAMASSVASLRSNWNTVQQALAHAQAGQAPSTTTSIVEAAPNQPASAPGSTDDLKGPESTAAAAAGPGPGSESSQLASRYRQLAERLEEAVVTNIMIPLHRNKGGSGTRSGWGAKRQRPVPPEQEAAELNALLLRAQATMPGIMMWPVNVAGQSAAKDRHDCVEIRLLCPRVFCASVLLASPGSVEAIRVALDSADNAADMDAWGAASTQVFRRLCSLATRALAYYRKRAEAALSMAWQGARGGAPPTTLPEAVALEDLLLWLAGYRDLFTKPCCMTGKLLAWDPSTQFPLPPVFRPYKLTRSQLQLLGRDPSQVQAFHMHVVPEHMLGWTEPELPRGGGAEMEH